MKNIVSISFKNIYIKNIQSNKINIYFIVKNIRSIYIENIISILFYIKYFKYLYNHIF